MQKKSNVIITHGSYGYPEENWFGWLKNKLAEEGIVCQVPAFSTPLNQHLNTWLMEFQKTATFINSHSILIGHSLGAAFILRWLERNHISVQAVILVGAFIGTIEDERFDIINQSFFQMPFNWEKLKKNSHYFISYYGTDDKYVKRDQYDSIAQSLNARKIIIANAGHFNSEAGYSHFPQLLSLIRNFYTY